MTAPVYAPDVDGFFRELGIDLPTRGMNAPVRCFNADAHRRGDRQASASVNRRTGAWKCHAAACGATGGAYDAAVLLGKSPAAAMELIERFGLKRDGSDDRAQRNGHDPILTTYQYTDEESRVLFEVVRTVGKRFWQRRPDGAGGQVKGLGETRRVLFRLPQVLAAAKEGQTVYIAEGEKDVLALERVGVVATCNPGGAGKWQRKFAEYLRAAQVTVVADRDDPGWKHAQEVARSLEGVAASVRVVEPAAGKDVSDHLAARKSLGELVPVELEASAYNGEVRVEGLRRLDVNRMVREQPPAVPWRIEPLAADGHLTMLYAVPGEGKSLLVAALAGAVADGEQLGGLACRRGGALYVDAENGAWEIHRRVKTLGLPAEGVAMYEASGFDLRRGVEGLERLVEAEVANLLVLDSLRSLAPGLDENDPAQVSLALDPLRQLAQRRGIAVVVIHHANKAGHDYRGSSAILASVDLAYRLGRVEGEDRHLRFLEARKVRIAAEPPKRWLRLSVEAGMVFIEEAEPVDEEPEGATRAVAEGGLIAQVEAALGPEPQTRADIARAVRPDPKDGSVGRALGYLAENERAVKRHGGWCQVPGASHPGSVAPRHAPENPHENGKSEGATEGAAPSPLLTEDELVEGLKREFDAREVSVPPVGSVWAWAGEPRLWPKNVVSVDKARGVAVMCHEDGNLETSWELDLFSNGVVRRVA